MAEIDQRRNALKATPERPQDATRRDALLEDLCRGLPSPLSPRNRGALREALKGFSVNEVERLSQAGLRLWPRDAPPPSGFDGFKAAFDDALKGATNPAYLPGARLLLFIPDTRAAQFRHELGHALDDLANEKGSLRRLDQFSGTARAAEVDRRSSERSSYASETGELHRVDGADGREQLTMTQMFERYRARVPENERSFDSPRTRKGYSKESVKEFIAEATAVFRGVDLESQARLLRYAPELYSVMERQTRAAGLPVPDRSFLERIRY